MFNSDEHYKSIIEHRDEIIADLYQKNDELKCDLELARDEIACYKREVELLRDENRELQSALSLYQRNCMGRN